MTVKARAEITLAGVSDGAKGDTGATGATGNGIESTAITYQASTSNTTTPTGTWSSTIPSVAAGSYLWTRTIITYTDGTTSTSYSVAKQGSTGAKGDKGDTGATGAAGADGKMLYGTCSTAAATAAKVATATGFELVSGTSVSIKFTYANTAASPTLNINSLGAKAVYVNGTRYAYWAAGSTVTFVYDGTQFQVCSVPVYANTVTVGNSAGQNVYIDSDSVDIRNGTTVNSSFSGDTVELGRNSLSSKINMCASSLIVGVDESLSRGELSSSNLSEVAISARKTVSNYTGISSVISEVDDKGLPSVSLLLQHQKYGEGAFIYGAVNSNGQIETYVSAKKLNIGAASLSGDLVDWVVAKGTSGIWTYRKWASGRAECWGITTISITEWLAWGSLYESNYYFQHSYPFTFNGEPSSYCQITLDGADLTLNISRAAVTDLAKKTHRYHATRPTSGATGTALIYHYAAGKWK